MCFSVVIMMMTPLSCHTSRLSPPQMPVASLRLSVPDCHCTMGQLKQRTHPSSALWEPRLTSPATSLEVSVHNQVLIRPLCPASVNISSHALDHMLVAPEVPALQPRLLAPVDLLHHLPDLPRDGDEPLPPPDDGWVQGIKIACLQSPVKAQVGVKRVTRAKKKQDKTKFEILHLCIYVCLIFCDLFPLRLYPSCKRKNAMSSLSNVSSTWC